MTSITRAQRRQQERQQKKLIKKFAKSSSNTLDMYGHKYSLDTSENLGLSKLSDPISDFAEPLYDSSWDEDGIRDIYDLVCSCWNIGTCPEEDEVLLWRVLIQPLLDNSFDDPEGTLEYELKSIISIRRSDFSDDRRFVMGMSLEFTPDNIMNLQVASAPLSPEEFFRMHVQKYNPQ